MEKEIMTATREESPKTETGIKRDNVADISAEDSLSEFLAEEYGCEKTKESVMRAHRAEKARKELSAKLREDSARRRYEELILESEEMKKLDADFSLDAELKNPRFRKLLQCGFDLADAWQLTHFDEILTLACERSEQQGYEKAVQIVREGLLRPEENGMRESSGVTEKKSVSSLSGGNIRDILRRVEKGAKIKF